MKFDASIPERERVLLWRTRQKISIIDASALLGISRNMFSKYEEGETPVPKWFLWIIDLTPETDESQNPTPQPLSAAPMAVAAAPINYNETHEEFLARLAARK